MFAFFKNIHNLTWKTAIGPRDYVWSYIRLSLWAILGAALLSGLIALTGWALMAFQLMPLTLTGFALIIPVALIGLALILAIFWVALMHIKIVVNRIHDFGYKARYVIPLYIVALIALAVGSNVLTDVALETTGALSPWGVFFKVCLNVMSLFVAYVFAFETGTDTARFEKTDILATPWSWWRTAIVALWVLLLVVSTLAPTIILLILI